MAIIRADLAMMLAMTASGYLVWLRSAFHA